MRTGLTSATMLSLALTTTSCCFWVSYIDLPGGRSMPASPEFSVVPPADADFSDSGLDFEAVYVDWGYLRFWPNGRVLSGHGAPESAVEADDFSHRTRGYYVVENDRVTIELYHGRFHNNCEEYFRGTSWIRGGQLWRERMELDPPGAGLIMVEQRQFPRMRAQPAW